MSLSRLLLGLGVIVVAVAVMLACGLAATKFTVMAAQASLPSLAASFPVLYINLDRDTERRATYEATLALAYPTCRRLERITGVPHASGREGCRLAHLRALARAYALNERYVLITEDDVVPSSSDGSLQTCLSEFHRQVAKLDAARAPVLLLLECGHGLERRISLKECRGGPHFRRILGGGNNTGAYLVRRDFIPALQLLWRAAWGMHIDGTWQYLWPFFEVWMAFPPPLKQRQARSNVVTGVRAECRAFDIDMYYAANRFL